GIERPLLEKLHVPDAEGMTDVFLYGASLRRVARAAEGGFFFAPAGTPAVDASGVFGSPRWALLPQGFQQAAAHMVVLLSSGDPGFEGVLGHADRVVILSRPSEGDALMERLLAAGQRIDACLRPEGEPVPEEEGGAPAAAADGTAP